MDVKNLKYSDLEIIEERPIRIKVGRRSLLIKPLPLRKVDEFEIMLANLLLNWRLHLQGISILDYNSLKDDISVYEFSELWLKALKSSKLFTKDVLKLICKPYGFSWRYFRKHATYEIMTQGFLATQLLNYEAVKKNVKFLLTRASTIQQSSTSPITSEEPSDGQKNGHLKPRY